MLPSHCNIKHLTDWVKADIPGRIEELRKKEEEMLNSDRGAYTIFFLIIVFYVKLKKPYDDINSL